MFAVNGIMYQAKAGYTVSPVAVSNVYCLSKVPSGMCANKVEYESVRSGWPSVSTCGACAVRLGFLALVGWGRPTSLTPTAAPVVADPTPETNVVIAPMPEYRCPRCDRRAAPETTSYESVEKDIRTAFGPTKKVEKCVSSTCWWCGLEWRQEL